MADLIGRLMVMLSQRININPTRESLLKNTLERRQFKRIEARRDVVIAPENSDNFLNVKLIDHSSHGVCFLSTHPFQVGTRIYIFTQNQPIDDFNDKFTEAYFADVIWCGKTEDQFRIGASIAKTDLLDTAISNKIPNVIE
jgi:hypothetical protein